LEVEVERGAHNALSGADSGGSEDVLADRRRVQL
jgi:hypothetical protein